MKKTFIALALVAGTGSGAVAQTYTPWKPAAGTTYVTPGNAGNNAGQGQQAGQGTGQQTAQAQQGGSIYQTIPAPAQPGTIYVPQPGQVEPYVPQPYTPPVYVPAPLPQQPGYQAPGQQAYPAAFTPSAAGWDWQLGAVLPDIEACLGRTQLKDPMIVGVYKGRRGANRVRIEGRGPAAAVAQEDCAVRRRGVIIGAVEADAQPVEGLDTVIYAPVGTRFVMNDENIMQPVISGGSQRLIGWLLRGRDPNGRDTRRMGDAVTINGYPD